MIIQASTALPSLAAVTAACLAMSLPLLAQAQNTATKPAARPAAKPAPKPAPKPAARPAARVAAPATAAAVGAAATTAAAPAVVSAEQMQAADATHVGTYECEFNQTVRVGAHPRQPGFIEVQYKQNTWTMKPLISSTGALRLEDVRGRILMLQIANKSMIMDTQIGQRLVDNCVHEKQKAFAAQPARESLGITPPAEGTPPR